MRWVGTYQCRVFWISQRIEEEILIWNLIKHLLYPLTNININYKYHKHLLKHQLANIHDQPVNNCIHQHQRNSSNPPMQPPSPTPHSDHPNHSVVLPEMAARSVKIHTNSKDGAFFWKRPSLFCNLLPTKTHFLDLFGRYVVGSSKTNHNKHKQPQPTHLYVRCSPTANLHAQHPPFSSASPGASELSSPVVVPAVPGVRAWPLWVRRQPGSGRERWKMEKINQHVCVYSAFFYFHVIDLKVSLSNIMNRVIVYWYVIMCA